ncbi:HsdM family class I SAM-dependent methyltransferase [Planktothrix agardhii]|uniref:HsdM family class I SAM-dependent methyltransferase n=1 Tax=Planktothrix agardhii TaxID=1160 RepID=UPI0020A7189D|nr:BREX-1 system adenine-specific DNA-methyltransferase PglX [Planktothrix agardhii]CAD5980955.1 putative adenine-specific methylase MJECS02 [Planktothrix agardhii]
MKLTIFNELDFLPALRAFFAELQVPINAVTDKPINARDILGNNYKDREPFELIDDVYFLGMVDDAAFRGGKSLAIDKIKSDYDGIIIFGVTLNRREGGLLPTRSHLAEIARAFNREFCYTPVVVVFKYADADNKYLAFANTERSKYKRNQEGEKAGKVTLLRDVSISNIHSAHEKIIFGDKSFKGLKIDASKVNSFKKLYDYWQTVFSLQALNDQFYGDLQDWFYYASQHIKLPFRPNYVPEKENIKNFLVRLLARTMFCWFIKEKGLIEPEILELRDWDGRVFPLVKDFEDENFLESNSYYRGVLQNIFFNSLNQKDKKSLKDFKWTKYLHSNFQVEWFTEIPYLNGGIFDDLDEDNAKESIEDTVMRVPNFLFYGIETEENVAKGKAKKLEVSKVYHKGLNGIFKSYKFTLEENTPYDEDIALDPELLGLVFENLLAELDPNLEENTIKSIRKQTGSYYTPRKVIQEMVNESLFIYLKKHTAPANVETLKKLVYENILDNTSNAFCEGVVNGIDRFKVLDPACGSGAFPMGVLHRLVDILKLVDPDNSKWLRLKLQPVDANYRDEFEKTLKQHLDDYSRKLGIIRDSIYGIDIQPLAVQITKLRFFISLLIDQKVEKGITPMPNIETKIICANSLKNIEPDLLSFGAIPQLKIARLKYYKPDLSLEEKQSVTDDIVTVLDRAFPSFSTEIMGKHIPGQNRELLRHWFTHATVAAPFFNLDFFYPELEGQGFDCVIGNPPYGGTKISDDVRKDLGIDSKDPYGAFIARFLASYDKQTPLKDGGVLAYIVSDTFMTIKSHHALRGQMMDNYIHKMIRVHPDTFKATVNTAIIICERNTSKSFNQDHVCQMVDMTNVSVHDSYSRFVELLGLARGVDFGVVKECVSNEEYGIYYYPQGLIRTNSNLPFFVASPKLFALMNDSNDPSCMPKTINQEIGGKMLKVRKIEMNGKEIRVVKLGDIADVKQGLATGDNQAYLFQNPDARGNYRSIEDFREYLLTEENLDKIRNNENLRLDVINKGISKDDPSSQRYFGGRYIVPYDKGGESDSDDGWMPNYFVTTDYFIDWSEWSINRMKTYTIAQRIREYKEKTSIKSHYETTNAAIIRSPDTYFIKGITYSRTGNYAPTFRVATGSVFDTKSCTLFFSKESFVICSLAYCSSKLLKFFFKNFQGHTVDAQVDDLKVSSFPLNILGCSAINQLSHSIIQKQKIDPYYDYASHEQIEIDKLVYEAYGLNAEDIAEVENWYARRYPKLSQAQKANLRKLNPTL